MGDLGIIGRGYIPESPRGDVGPSTPEPVVPGRESTNSGTNCYNLTPFPGTNGNFSRTLDGEYLRTLRDDSI